MPNSRSYAGPALTRAKGILRDQINRDPMLNNNARRVAGYLLDNRLNSTSLTIYPGNDTIAADLNCSVRTAQRAIGKLTITGYLKKLSHPRRSNTHCFPELDRVFGVTRSSDDQCHSCHRTQANMSGQTGQECHPTLKKEPKEDPRREDLDLSFPRYVIEEDSEARQSWDRALGDQGLGKLEDYEIFETSDRGSVIIVPANYPPASETAPEWSRTKKYFEPRRRP